MLAAKLRCCLIEPAQNLFQHFSTINPTCLVTREIESRLAADRIQHPCQILTHNFREMTHLEVAIRFPSEVEVVYGATQLGHPLFNVLDVVGAAQNDVSFGQLGRHLERRLGA